MSTIQSEPASSDPTALVEAYCACLAFAERAPSIVWVKGGWVPYPFPAYGLLRYLVAWHVRRGLATLRRGLSRSCAAGSAHADTAIEKTNALQDALPPVAPGPRVTLIVVVVALLLLRGAGPLEDEIDLVVDVVRGALVFDLDAVTEALRDADSSLRFRAALLTAVAPLALLSLPQMSFWLKRAVFLADPSTLEPGRAEVRKAPVGVLPTYSLEAAVFDELRVRRPRELQLDVLFLASIVLPLLVAIGLVAIDVRARDYGNEESPQLEAFFVIMVAALSYVAVQLLWRHRRLERLPPHRLQGVRTLIAVGASCALVLVAGAAASPSGLFLDHPATPTLDVDLKFTSVSPARVARDMGVDLTDRAGGDWDRIQSGRRAARGGARRGVRVFYRPYIDPDECPCYTRWALHDATTDRPVAPSWRGLTWPLPRVTFTREGLPYWHSGWVPLRNADGVYYVWMTAVRERDGKKLAAAPTPLFRVEAGDTPRVRRFRNPVESK